MKKAKASPNGETSDSTRIIPFFSKNEEILENDWLRLRLAVLTAPRENEPQSLRRDRARVLVALKTFQHLKKENLSPIFGAWEYEALKLKGEARND